MARQLTVVLIIAVLLFVGARAWTRPLHGYKVLKVIPQTDRDVEILNRVEKIPRLQTSFWLFPSVAGHEVHLMVAPVAYNDIQRYLSSGTFTIEVMIEDVQELAEQQLRSALTPAENEALGLKPSGFNYGKYHTYDEIMDWTSDMIKAYPTMVQDLGVGNSFEGRTMPGILITTEMQLTGRVPGPDTARPAVYYQSGMHAREWIGPATVMYMTAKLLNQYGKDKNVTDLLNNVDVYVVLLANPDGYYYSWETDRSWRKTRTNNTGSTCVGVDPNRNFDIKFAEKGASQDPCSDDYCGPNAFSTIEMTNVASIMLWGRNTFLGFIDFHSYSQLWMTPWAYTKDLPKDYDTQLAGCKEIVASLKAVNGTIFQCGTIANLINYLSSGSSADWTYGKLGITYSYGVELRDTGKYGFLLPPDQIIPSGNETYEGLKTFVEYVRRNM